MMSLNDLISPQAVIASLKANGKKQALIELSERAAEVSGLDTREILDALIQRERLKSDLQLEHLELVKMREINELRTTFFTNISHEFRTPLTLILSPLKSMYAGNFRGDIRQQYRVMIRNAERLLRLINQLLDLSKFNAHRMRLAAAKGDLIDFLKPIFASFESYAERKQLRYHFHFPEGEVQLYFDPDKLEKIMTNLLANAFKYTDTGRITLSVRYLHFENDAAEEQLDIDHVGVHLHVAFDDFQNFALQRRQKVGTAAVAAFMGQQDLQPLLRGLGGFELARSERETEHVHADFRSSLCRKPAFCSVSMRTAICSPSSRATAAS